MNAIDNEGNNALILLFIKLKMEKTKKEDRLINALLNVCDINHKNSKGFSVFCYLYPEYYCLYNDFLETDVEMLKYCFSNYDDDFFEILRYFQVEQLKICSSFLCYDILLCEAVMKCDYDRVNLYLTCCSENYRDFIKLIYNQTFNMLKISDCKKIEDLESIRDLLDF